MERAEQLRVIKLLMQRLDDGETVDAGGIAHCPVSAYTCPDRARDEWEHLFQQHPQVMGLSADLPEPGSFMTASDELDKPILMTRDRDGQFRAFLNVCRHRGTIVEGAERGRKNVFSCPFHAWSYSSAGDLVSVPKEEHFGPIDKSCNGLVELPAVERYGLLWLHADPKASFDLDELLGDMGPELGSWGLDRLTFAALERYDTPMNWKLAIDTFGETYHFNTLHKNTLANTLHGNVQTYDKFGRNHRMMLCNKDIDGLRNQPESQWHVLTATVPVYYLFPNIQLIPNGRIANTPMGDLTGLTLVRVYPDKVDPNKSFSLVSFYVNRDYVKGDIDSVRQRVIGFGEIIRDEDYVAAAASHRGAQSGAIDHFVFGHNEPALHHYHNNYNEVLGLPRLPIVSN